MRDVDNKYKSVPFWSWNDDLDEKECVRQVEWMHENGIGGFFMHARGGLKTPYLGEQWFKCIDACGKRAEELGMHAYAYDENGWPSGFVGGLLLEDIENHDRYLDYKVGPYDKDAWVSYDMSGDKLVRVTSGENCLNVYWHYSTSTADICNPDVVQQFIDKTHEQYKKHDTYGLKGFFTDEPQYYRWSTAYTKVVDKYFEDVYKEDIKDGVGLLFVEKEGYREFRYKYWKAMQTLMLNNFGKKVYDWCDSNNYKLTGHYVEETVLGFQVDCCGGIMPYYEYEHIPGIDKLSRSTDSEVATKQLGSVAAQLNKKQTLCEMFACAGWDVTPKELKKIAEHEFYGGVNLICQHLLPYSEHGQRKRDYPSHFSAVNPWIEKNFKEFNDYFSVLGEILSKSTERPNVAVLHPIRSCYFTYKKESTEPDFGCGDISFSFGLAMEDLSHKQIPHHYLDETLLAKYGSIKGNKFVMGACEYEYVIIPKMYTMDKTTESLLHQFVLNGGKVLLLDKKPECLEWNKYDYDYLVSNTTLEEIRNSQPFQAEENESIRTAFRVDYNGNPFIYAFAERGATKIKFDVKGYKSFKSYNILKDEYEILPLELDFEDGESRVLYLSNEEPLNKVENNLLTLGKEFKVVGQVDNLLTIDYLQYSFDGITYSEKLHHMGVFFEMLDRKHKGDLYLKYSFTAKEVPSKCFAMIENMNIKEVKINGKTLTNHGFYGEKDLFDYDVAKYLHKGKNEVVVLINWWQSDIVYYALFGENVTESIKNCLAYDTDIEAMYLRGNFGVFGDFEQGKDETILLGDNFYLDKPKTTIKELITDGYPFFSGNITLEQNIHVNDVNKSLCVDKRFHLIDVAVNDIYCGRMMFSNYLDLSNALKVGDNKFDITLTVGRRNMLGPLHSLNQEDIGVGPYSFERVGTWVKGKSKLVLNKYAFVKTIL